MAKGKGGFNVVLQHTTWSPSKAGGYAECPAKMMYKHLQKLPDPGGPALERGSAVHEQCEFYVRGVIKTLAAVHKGHEMNWNAKTVAELKRLRKLYSTGRVRTELDAAVRKDWSSCEWMAKGVWARFKLDLVELSTKNNSAIITDWKTGKFKPDGEYDDQLELYCVAVLCAMPEINVVSARLWFTDVGEPVTRPQGRLDRAGLPAVLAKWEKKVAPMMKDVVHAPTPNATCRYCPYSVQKKGPCKF